MFSAVFHISNRFFALLCFCLVSTVAVAQSFPNQPITLVVPYPPGASVDLQARLLQPKMSEILGQQVIVENRAGAGGNIGAASVARAKPDGYHILLATNAGMVINPHVYKNLGFDVMKDLKPVTLLSKGGIAIGVSSKLGIGTLAELVAYGKKNPGKLTYGTPGAGSPQHLIGALLAQQAGIEMTHVPYRGIAPALNDLLGGNIDIVISTLAGFTSQMGSDKLKIIAVASEKRDVSVPSIPTVAETYPGFEASAWFAIMAPAGTPDNIVAKLNDAVIAAEKTPEMQKALTTSSLTGVGQGPEALSNLIRSDYELWGKVVRDNGITVN